MGKGPSKGERTAEKILEATAHCIATFGIEKTSITRISEAADVSRGLVAHYFPEKSKMFLQVIQHIAEKAYRDFESSAKPKGPKQELETVLRANLDFFLKRPDYMKCFILFYYYCGVDRACRKLNTELTRVGRERIEKALAAFGIRDREIAHSIHAQLVGSILQYYAVNEGMDRESFVENFLAQVREQVPGA